MSEARVSATGSAGRRSLASVGPLVLVVLLVIFATSTSSAGAATNVMASMTASVAAGTAPDGTPDSATASSSPQAGSDDNFTEGFTFTYGGASSGTSTDGTYDRTIQTLTLQLPPAMLDRLAPFSEFCTADQLGTMPSYDGSTPGTGWIVGGSGCPSDTEIGSLSGHVSAKLGLQSTLPITGNLYIMAAPTGSGDVARIAAEVSVLGSPSVVASGPIDLALNAQGQPQLTASLTLPAEAVPPLVGGLLPYTLLDLTQTINGLTPGGQAFQIMPHSDATATATTNVSVQQNGVTSGSTPGSTDPGLTGSGQASITPTGAGSLPYAPRLSTSVVRDSADPIVTFTNTITQAADEAPSKSITLQIPANLQAYGNALYELCATPAADDSNCAQVGTATAQTPLLSTPLSGKIYLTGQYTAPTLLIRFPAPFAISIAGSVNLAANTVSFTNVPDLPLTSLAVLIAGNSGGIFYTTCTTSTNTGSVTGAFVGQNGASASSAGAFTINGCPAPSTTTTTASTTATTTSTPTTSTVATLPPPQTTYVPTTTSPSKPTASGSTPKSVLARASGTLKRAGATGARMTLSIARTAGAPDFYVIHIAAPAGAHFRRGHLRTNVTGLKGLRSRTISHGQLVLTYTSVATRANLVIRGNTLVLSPKLAKRIRAKKVTSLPTKIVLTTTRGTERLSAKLRIR